MQNLSKIKWINFGRKPTCWVDTHFPFDFEILISYHSIFSLGVGQWRKQEKFSGGFKFMVDFV